MKPEVMVASLSRTYQKDIDASWEALKDARSPRIHTFIAVSDIHMRYKLKMTEDQVLEQAVAAVKYAKKYCEDVQFSAEDASRADREFLARVVEATIAAGATTINIPDTVGYASPEEFGGLIAYLRERVANIHKADIAVHCHNDLGLAVGNTLSAAVNGAVQLECTINGLGERGGNASLEEIVMNLATRKDYYKLEHGIDTAQIYRTSKMAASITGVDVQANKAIVGANAFVHESGIHQHGMLANAQTYEIMTPQSVGVPVSQLVLGKLSGKHAFEQKVSELGFELSGEQLSEAFKMFKQLADRKKTVRDADIEAILTEGIDETVQSIRLETFQISAGNTDVSTATIRLRRGEESLFEAATGNGPVEAAFNAVDRILGTRFVLESFNLKAVTEGRDALGEVGVKISRDGRFYVGRGLSTDVIEAAIKAYISAVNKAI